MLTLTYNYRKARFQDYNKAQYSCVKEIFRNEYNWKFILYVALYVIVCCDNNIKLYKIRRGMYIYKNYLNKYHYLKIWSSGTKEGIFFQNWLIIISYLNSMHLQILSPTPPPWNCLVIYLSYRKKSNKKSYKICRYPSEEKRVTADIHIWLEYLNFFHLFHIFLLLTLK